MLDKLEAIKAKFEDLGVALTNPSIISDNRKFGQLSKEYRSLEKIVRSYEGAGKGRIASGRGEEAEDGKQYPADAYT
jgi:protein subunit release factor A